MYKIPFALPACSVANLGEISPKIVNSRKSKPSEDVGEIPKFGKSIYFLAYSCFDREIIIIFGFCHEKIFFNCWLQWSCTSVLMRTSWIYEYDLLWKISNYDLVSIWSNQRHQRILLFWPLQVFLCQKN